MTKRVAALFGLFAFAVAWLVGVWCGHAPTTRLVNAAIALASGYCAGLGVGVAIERIVLARLAQNWQGKDAPPSAAEAAPAVHADAATGAGAGAHEAEAVAAGGEAQR
jgi:hypothetical protein